MEGVSVYARVSPEDKIRIVKAWQKKGAVAAMTGDGVNDAPALKAADIGCAMGITGTEVAKGAADMVLTDDNFATIVEAVREGRGIYENIRKVVGFLLGTNIGEVLAVFFAMLLWRQSPLLSMQLLWINLVTDSMPAIALGMEPVEPGLMDRAPKPREEGIFARGLGLRVALQGAMFAALSLVSFWLGLQRGGLAPGRTMAFITLAVSQLVQAYNMRSHRSLFQMRAFGNRTLNLACGASLLLMLVVVFTPLRIPFGLAVLPPSGYFTAFGLCLVPLVVMEAAKAAVEEAKAALEADQEELADTKAEAEETRRQLDAKLSATVAEIQSIEQMEKEFLADIAAKQKEMKETQEEIDRIYAEMEAMSEFVGGTFMLPVPGYASISSYYGWRFNGSDFHTGVDFTGKNVNGKSVVAANAGNVIFTKTTYIPNKSYGKYIIVDHGGGYSTLYAHLSSVNVSVGDYVEKGENIGNVGSTGPHLHFEVRINGKHTNPLPYLKG